MTEPAVPRARTSGKAIASLVFGLAGIFVIPFLLSLVALFLGFAARNEIREDPMLAGDGFAVAGICLGIIGVLLGLFFLLFLVAVV